MKTKTLICIVVVLLVLAAAIYWFVPMPLSAECQARQQQLKQQIGQLNYCTVTNDCEAQALYCPFDCWVFVNKQADFSQVKSQVDAYGSECGVCLLACPSEPPRPDCIEGKCIVP